MTNRILHHLVRLDRIRVVLAVMMALSAMASPARAQDEDSSQSSEYLVVNNPRTKKFSFQIGNVTVGNSAVVDFRADRKNNRLTLLPRGAGSTLLLVYDDKGRQRTALQLTVYPADPELLLSEVTQLLRDVEGVTIRRMDERVIIDGEVLLPEDKDRIRKIAMLSKNIVDLTKLNPNTDHIIAKKIQREIGMDEVTVRALKGRILLEGEVYSKQARAKAETIASLYADKVINVLEVRELGQMPSRKEMVQVTAHFVEVAKNYTKNFNFRWNPIPRVGTSFSYTMNPVSGSDNFTGAVTGTLEDILPKLNYFRALGVARIIENPSVSVKSGDTATIESGTRIGFPIVQSNGAVSLEFQNIGATLKITPHARNNDVDMAIDMSISSLGSPDVTGGVAIEQSAVQTSQLVRSGESVVVGGLVRYSNRQTIDRPPVQNAGSTPQSTSSGFADPFPLGSLFTLFKSTDLGKQRSQFMVFITPRILKFAKDANQEIKDQFNLYQVYPNQGGDPNSSGKASGGEEERK